MIEERKCRGRCKEWKALFLFPTDKTCSGGRSHKCSECKNAERRQGRARVSQKREVAESMAMPDCPAIRDAWMATRLPVFGGGFGAARISAHG